MQLRGRSIVITGAGSGIGKALTLAMAPFGVGLTLVGRRESPLDDVASAARAAGAQARVVATDLTVPGALERIVEVALDEYGKLDVLVNNAGNVRAGRLEKSSPEEIRAQIELNVVAPILLIRLALPALRASGEGLIVNVSSAIALVGMPFYATYAATKAAIANFGEALRRELLGEGVSVLTVYPGATSTPMMESSSAGPEEGFDYEPPEAVAAAILEGIETDQLSVIRGGSTRMAMIQTNREHPEAVDAKLFSMKDRLEAAVSNHSSIRTSS